MKLNLHQLEPSEKYSDNFVFEGPIIVNDSQICYIKKNKFDIPDSVKEQILEQSSHLTKEDLKASVIYMSNSYKIIVAESMDYISKQNI